MLMGRIIGPAADRRTPGMQPREVTLRCMSSRLDSSWSVLASHQTAEGDRCVDLFARPDGTYGFEEFRRDPEDMGAWTPVSFFSGSEYATASDALGAARRLVPWLAQLIGG